MTVTSLGDFLQFNSIQFNLFPDRISYFVYSHRLHLGLSLFRWNHHHHHIIYSQNMTKATTKPGKRYAQVSTQVYL